MRVACGCVLFVVSNSQYEVAMRVAVNTFCFNGDYGSENLTERSYWTNMRSLLFGVAKDGRFKGFTVKDRLNQLGKTLEIWNTVINLIGSITWS